VTFRGREILGGATWVIFFCVWKHANWNSPVDLERGDERDREANFFSLKVKETRRGFPVFYHVVLWSRAGLQMEDL